MRVLAAAFCRGFVLAIFGRGFNGMFRTLLPFAGLPFRAFFRSGFSTRSFAVTYLVLPCRGFCVRFFCAGFFCALIRSFFRALFCGVSSVRSFAGAFQCAQLQKIPLPAHSARASYVYSLAWAYSLLYPAGPHFVHSLAELFCALFCRSILIALICRVFPCALSQGFFRALSRFFARTVPCAFGKGSSVLIIVGVCSSRFFGCFFRTLFCKDFFECTLPHGLFPWAIPKARFFRKFVLPGLLRRDCTHVFFWAAFPWPFAWVISVRSLQKVVCVGSFAEAFSVRSFAEASSVRYFARVISVGSSARASSVRSFTGTFSCAFARVFPLRSFEVAFSVRCFAWFLPRALLQEQFPCAFVGGYSLALFDRDRLCEPICRCFSVRFFAGASSLRCLAWVFPCAPSQRIFTCAPLRVLFRAFFAWNFSTRFYVEPF